MPLTALERAQHDSTEALTTIKMHIAECTRASQDTTTSILRVHARLDEIQVSEEARRKDEMERREQRDRDTRQTLTQARIATWSVIFAAAVSIGLHFWK